MPLFILEEYKYKLNTTSKEKHINVNKYDRKF